MVFSFGLRTPRTRTRCVRIRLGGGARLRLAQVARRGARFESLALRQYRFRVVWPRGVLLVL